MAVQSGPRFTRPWAPIGLGWLAAVAVVGIVGGTFLGLWGWTELLDRVCLLLLAAAVLL